MKVLILISVLTLLLMSYCNLKAQNFNTDVNITGAMKNVMWKGQLYGNIDLDTISDKQHLYGFGPVEFLTGELLVVDGKSYKSSVMNDTLIKVEETFNVKAPFFAYAKIDKWNEQAIPDSILSLIHLENFLDETTKSKNRPFIFKLVTDVDSAAIHIVNLPVGVLVNSPEDVFRHQKKFEIINEKTEIMGFFSTEHKTIFTHHNTFLHLHLITADRQKMGHLDEVKFKKGTLKLYLPVK